MGRLWGEWVFPRHESRKGSLPPAQKPTARTTKFQMQHIIEFGFQVIQCNIHTKEVCSVHCQFCNYIGKESAIGEKHKCLQTEIVKDWKAPFRTTNYRLHHEGQHQGTWAAYQKLSYEAKSIYFDNMIKHKDTINSHFGVSKRTHTVYSINACIVDKIIGNIFFHPDDQNGVTHRNVMQLFHPDPEAEDIYLVTIKYPMQFHLIVSWLACGISFRQAEDLLVDTK